MESIKQKILKQNPKLKNSSAEHYISTLKKLSEYLSFKKFNIKYFNDYTTIIDFIENESNFALPTKRNYIIAILVVLKTNSKLDKKILDAYSDYHKKLTNIQNDLYSNNVKSEKEEINWISMEDVMDKIKSIKKQIEGEIEEINTKSEKEKTKLVDLHQQYVILNLYTKLPPMRNDYAGEMYILEDEKKGYSKKNRIILNNNHLILCDYKTSESYGPKIIDIPEDLKDILIEWVKIRTDIYNKKNKNKQSNLTLSDKVYLLIKLTDPNSFMTKNMLTKTLNKIFYPKKVSTTLLRKIYLSEKYPVINTYKEMKNDAYIMGHDINTAKLIYSKKL